MLYEPTNDSAYGWESGQRNRMTSLDDLATPYNQHQQQYQQQQHPHHDYPLPPPPMYNKQVGSTATDRDGGGSNIQYQPHEQQYNEYGNPTMDNIHNNINNSSNNNNHFDGAGSNGYHRDANEDYYSPNGTTLRGSARGSASETARLNSYDDGYSSYSGGGGQDPRVSRMAIAEAAIRQDMFKEFTFKPAIKPLPSSYGAMKDTGASFQARVNKWQRDKTVDLQRKMQSSKQNELTECTFRPKINRNSERAIREIRGEAEEDANERLYRSSNLYAEQRMRQIEAEKMKEENMRRQECTFQPRLVTQPNLYDVGPKYRTIDMQQQEEIILARDPTVKECTFKPKVNELKPHMSSAKLYTSANVVDRLTRPLSAALASSQLQGGADDSMRAFDYSFTAADQGSRRNSASGGVVMDMGAFMSGGNPGNQFLTPGSAGNRGGGGSAGSGGGGSTVVDDEEQRQQRRKRFEQFLGRQTEITRRREENLKQLERTMTPKFTPSICKKSIQLTSNRRLSGPSDTEDGDEVAKSARSAAQTAQFLARVERHIQRKAMEQQERQFQHEENCTFAPKINKKSEKLPPRTPFDMSKGDLIRQETSRRLLQLQSEQQIMAGATFRPKISSLAQDLGKSSLQLASDPDTYLDRYREHVQERKKEIEEELQRREEEQLEGCTFTPTTIDCPAYVKRIAKSMSIVRAARSSNGSLLSVEQQQDKPTWR